MLIGMAPPKQGTPIQVRLPDGLLAQIDKRAKGKDISRAEAIRRMLVWAARQPISREEGV